MNYSVIKEIIKKYGLKPDIRRNLPLLLTSCVDRAYTKLLPREFSISYRVIVTLGREDFFQSFYNLDDLGKQTEKMINRYYPNLKPIFTKALAIYKEHSKVLIEAEKNIVRQPEKYLKFVIKHYPAYLTSVAFYNCFWRYIGNNSTRGRLTKAEVAKISKERDLVSRFYPRVELAIKKCVAKIGRQQNFDGDLLRYLTIYELGDFLNGKNVKSLLGKARTRRKGYVYFPFKNKVQVVCNQSIIKKIETEFLKVDLKVNEVKGYSAYPGIVRGTVFNLEESHKLKTKRFILVIDHTTPGETALIKKSSAVVINEGGILTHAAIICRELKKPCIIGTKIATKVFKDGDLVEVDANKGIIKRL
jgi:phosphohistidine swiveling domain-containing protein